jgi:site-specific recombinase XerD
MSAEPNFAILLESYFTERLMKQRFASANTIKAYRDTFHLFVQFAQQRLGKQPSQLELREIDAPLVTAFLLEMEKTRRISARSRNARLAAIRSFFRYAALEAPAQSAQIQRVLAIPPKKHTKELVHFLVRSEIEALLAAPNTRTWSGRRDHALLLLAVQTGLRLSELTSLTVENLVLGRGAHVRVIGKGRKERCVPLAKQTVAILRTWIEESVTRNAQTLFPNARGERLSSDGVQYILSKHASTASKKCPSLKAKKVTPHVLRHSCAMELLQAGVDRAMIALWLGHESVETTQMYLHANLAFMQQLLDKTTPLKGKPGRFRTDDQLLAFLKAL